MTRRTHSVVAFLLAVLMVLNLAGTIAVAAPEARATDIMQNDNQSSGIVLTKGAKANDDGTVDVTIEAYTTGKVTNTNATVPTDIVLVLDVSGSMAEKQASTYKTEYVSVNGGAYERYSDWWWRTFYGFEGQGDYYIKVNNELIPVHKEGFDSNRYDYYRSDITGKSYYPVLDSSITPDRVNNYEVVQFYQSQSVLQAEGEVKMTVMQEAVNKFIKETATKNASITDTSKQHRISIIKFAGDSYYTSGKTVTGNTDVANAALPENYGDNKYNRSSYNYTQVVKGLTPVNSSNVDTFTSAVSSLSAGGATAVDYGVALAEQVLLDRTISDKADRKEVVVVFTDGEPTHGSSYSSSVAATAVGYASNLKKADTVVYSISMEAHADSSVLEVADYEGNKFMHYLSSNYPNATASVSTIVPGTGDIKAGYYMTPSEEQSLEMIFDTIVHQIGAPTISLGEEATVYDHLSTYFDLNGALAESVKTYTSARKQDGTWATPQAETFYITSENENSTIIVTGFDFDANYISDTPRDGNNYGKKLIIKITVKPDYTAIERHKEEIKAAGGWVATNNGNALVEDTHDNIAARVASPAVLMNKVTYLVDGAEYDFAYLMPTHKHTVIAKPTKEGHDFSGWSSDDNDVNLGISAGEFTMPARDVVIEGNFTAKEYKVEYKYNVDPVPTNWPTIPDDYNFENGQPITHKFGDGVTIKPKLTLDGFEFVGWTATNSDLAIANNEFVMPAHDITFIAHFEPIAGGVEYKVQHFLEIRDEADDTVNKIINGRYSHEYFEVDDTSVAGKKFGRVYEDTRKGTATVMQQIAWVEYHGFTKLEGAPSVLSGMPDNGDLVLKLYYTRNTNNVSYSYEPITGITMPSAPVDNNDYYYGQQVTGKQPADANTYPQLKGYKFTGWIPDVSTQSGKLMPGATFPMPDIDVHFVGHYVADDVNYKVEYYCEPLTGVDYEKVEEYIETAKTGDRVSAQIRHYDGFKLNPTHADSNEDDIVRGDGTTIKTILKVYYDRESYKVRYDWIEPQVQYIVDNRTLPAETTVKFGEKFKVVAKLADANDGTINYTFNGWHSQDIDVHPDTDLTTEFTMSNHDVVIYGGFVGAVPESTTVIYDKHDPITNEPEHEPSEDETEVHHYIIVDTNGGTWTHDATTYGVGEAELHARLHMQESRVLEAAEKTGYEFVGWANTDVSVDATVLDNYTGAVDTTDVAHVYVAQYKAIVTPPAPGGGGGGGVTKYTLSYESNGGTKFGSERYTAGTVVEITNVPTREGYTFDGWHTNAGLTELVKSVKMNRDITVYAAWIIEKDEDEFVQEEDDIISPIPDMLDGENHISYVIGYNDGTVRPNADITRAEVSAVFFRLLKSDIREANLTDVSPYTDVEYDKWYKTAVATMSKLGILEGIGNDRFSPDTPITRAEFAAICARFDDTEIESTKSFTDIAGHWAETEIREAAARGWIKGYDDNTFRPNNPITRAEAMVLINRVLHRVPKTVEDLLANTMITWPDNNDKSKWYYIAVQEATNSHKYERMTEIYEKWTMLIANVDWAKYEK